MKKVILTALLLAASATSALAFSAFTGSTTVGAMAFNTSNKVIMNGVSATTGYVFESLHLSGSRVFATDSAASVVYWRDAAIGGTTAASATGWAASYAAPTSSGTHGTPALPTGYQAL